MAHNFIDPNVQDPAIGTQHLDNVLQALWQPTVGNPGFTAGTPTPYFLTANSPARATAPHGLDFGATIAPGCYLGTLPAAVTAETTASITVGGPGIFAYRWRLNGGAWSAAVSIAPGVFPRTGATQRTAMLALSNLASGTQNLEVVGQDFAGYWQAQPTAIQWLVATTAPRTYPDWLLWHGTTHGQDTDTDGLDTLVEYALGSHPKQFTTGPVLPAFADNQQSFEFPLPQDALLTQGHGRPGIRYQIEASTTLASSSWQAIAIKTPNTAWTGPVTVLPVIQGSVPIRVTPSASPNAPQRQFFRLRAVVIAE